MNAENVKKCERNIPWNVKMICTYFFLKLSNLWLDLIALKVPMR